ncbi:MAG TPA: hypothetical protein VK524_33595 [Polyangiaceae bacterium]|nr:hypothetical protein [Polyangiaceae bacterium]
MADDFSALPGGELVERGLAELRRGLQTSHALLVAIAAPNLRRLGFALPGPDELPDTPELSLYRLLRRERPKTAYVEYNALIRRLVSFERALERERASAARRAGAI